LNRRAKDKVFERFHRVESAGRSIEGTGIGLALTLEIVKLLGGTMDLVSKLNFGSTFSIRLPIGKAHLAEDRIDEDYTTGRSLAATRDVSRRSYRHGVLDEVSQWEAAPESMLSRPFAETSSAVSTSDTSTIAGDDDESTAPHGPLSLRGSRILVADDNSDMRRYISSVLAAAHYSIYEVADGQAALDHARLDPPDLVLSDISASAIRCTEFVVDVAQSDA
jgi:CheY-like chemotaxis protein